MVAPVVGAVGTGLGGALTVGAAGIGGYIAYKTMTPTTELVLLTTLVAILYQIIDPSDYDYSLSDLVLTIVISGTAYGVMT